MKHCTLQFGLGLVLLAACDSGTKAGADPKASAAVDVKADAKADAKAGADLQAQAGADVKAPTAGAAVVGGSVVALKPVAEVEAALGKPIVLASADLDLAAVLKLVVEGKIRSAVELELLLNAPVTANAGASHRIDLDADGTLDYLQVVEVRSAGAVNLELRAIASSKLDASLAVLVATIATARADADGKLLVSASYGADVKGGADFKFSREFAAEFKGGAVALADASAGAFFAWTVDVARPTYTSTHVSAADITVAADGGVQFGADASVRLSAEQLAALRASLKVELAALAVPDAKLEVGGKAGAGVKVKHDAKVESSAKASSSAKAGASAGVKIGGGGGGKVGGSVGVSLGGGASIGGGGKAGAGVKIGGK